MKVCVVGSGGREHVLAHVLGRTADEVVVAPGNPGIPGSTATPPEAIDADLFVIGPEAPLVDGLADRLRGAGKLVFGPGGDGARLEGSKTWMKQLLTDARVPTARWATFGADEVEEALKFLDTLDGLYVVKTDGLAAGKGVFVTSDREEAAADLRAKLAGESFGAAGTRVVIEEGLTGPELSILAVCDGRTAVPLAPSQDFKRLADGDEGPNTGGMGAYSPVPIVSEGLVDRIMDEAVEPTLAALRRQGIDYRGVLYCGLMLTADGPRVIEYNVRFGDPEAQVVLPRLSTDLVELLEQAARGRIRTDPRFVTDAAVTVVLAAAGYPQSPRAGDPIMGLDDLAGLAGVTAYCAGVASDPQGRLVTDGGRVLAVTALGADLGSARAQAYLAADRVRWEGQQRRDDIARHAAETAA